MTGLQYVLTPDDLDWAEVDSAGHPNTDFMFTPSVIDKDYTDAYSSRLGLMRPGKGSGVHTDPYNHAFYFLQGTGELQIGEERWSLQPGTIVKIPAGKVHGFSNTGSDDLVFLVIYDPPYWSARSLSGRLPRPQACRSVGEESADGRRDLTRVRLEREVAGVQ